MPEVVEADYVDGATPPGERRSHRSSALALVLVVAVVATVAGILQVTGSDDGTRVSAEAEGGVPVPVTAPAQAPRVELAAAPGWQLLLADGDDLVYGTRPLTDRDLLLAVLARDDAVFADFPPDGAVLVVGGDRLQAKYVGPSPGATVVSTPNGVEITEPTPPAAAGPALGLGPPTPLAGGVTVRRGDVPNSSSVLAAYLGPQAPDRLATEAEAMAASVHLLPFDFSTLPPPPGSRPGFDAGGVDLPPGQGRVVARSDGSAGTYTVEADGDCAIVVPGSFPESALGGGCLTVPADGVAPGVAALAVDRGPPAGPPPPVPGGGFVQPTAVAGEDLAVVVLARVGADTDGLTAVLVDGRTVDATVGDDGWALVVTDGRPYLLEARDGKGRVTGVTPVT